jgi:hypothetical protein
VLRAGLLVSPAHVLECSQRLCGESDDRDNVQLPTEFTVRRKGGFSMRRDLRNIFITSQGEGRAGAKVLIHHRAFPELRGEGRSPGEGLLELLGLLKRASGGVEDSWHGRELDGAIFDVESMIRLLVTSENLKIKASNCTITKIHDLIYVSSYGAPDESPPKGEVEGDAPSERERTVVIFSVGRRFGDRRWTRSAGQSRPAGQDRRGSERRGFGRRQLNRLKLLDEIPAE